jgi:hypothetical protein
MTAKNVVAKNWPILASFDGKKYSTYPNGDKPSGYMTTPKIAFIDNRDGQITGGLTGNGLPIRLYGYSLGRASALGTTAGARVYMRDPLGDNTWHEVGKYWYLTTSVVYNWLQLMELCFEPGALGGSMVAGRTLDIKVTVNGVDSAVYLSAFTIQPGPFFYVDHNSGNDSTGAQDDSTKPFAHLQVYNGSTAAGLAAVLPTTGGATVLVKGQTSDNLGWEGKYFKPRYHTGSVADGTLGKGRLKILNWPTLFGPSNWTFTGPAADNGGISGVSQAQYGVTGMYITISGYKGIGNPTGANDAAPINGQAGARGWDIIGCDCSWNSTTTGTGTHATAGAIAGQFEGSARILACYLHDVYGDPAFNENHSLYLGDAAGVCTKDTEVAWNVMKNAASGSNVQINNSNSSDTFSNLKIHHNWLESAKKYAINQTDSVLSLDAWNNVIVNPQLNAWRCGNAQASAQIRFTHNTVIQSASDNGTEGNGMLAANALTSGSYVFAYNIFVRGGNGGSMGVTYATFGSGTTAVTMSHNQYFDTLGTLTTLPTQDTTGAYGDPKFTDYSNKVFTLQAGSPCLNAVTAAELFAVNDDFYGYPREVLDTSAPTTSHNDIGACEGVGT